VIWWISTYGQIDRRRCDGQDGESDFAEDRTCQIACAIDAADNGPSVLKGEARWWLGDGAIGHSRAFRRHATLPVTASAATARVSLGEPDADLQMIPDQPAIQPAILPYWHIRFTYSPAEIAGTLIRYEIVAVIVGGLRVRPETS
jgi:hypothetical protein